jgi:hypothetical protein
MEWSIKRNRCFFDVSNQFHYSFSPVADFGITNFIIELIHLPGLRNSPGRLYNRTSISDVFPGTFENYMASIIYSWQSQKKEELNTLGDQLKRLGLTWKVKIKPVNETMVEILVGRLPRASQGGAEDLVNISDVGYGVSQVLPVLVALLSAKPGQTIMIEQPEIHLHPNAQKILADIFVENVLRGVRIIVETHSSIFIRRLQTLIAIDSIPNEAVGLNWFMRNSSTGSSSIVSTIPEIDGSTGDWPSDFDDVMYELDREYLNSIDDE